jgi:hypothetical protein
LSHGRDNVAIPYPTGHQKREDGKLRRWEKRKLGSLEDGKWGKCIILTHEIRNNNDDGSFWEYRVYDVSIPFRRAFVLQPEKDIIITDLRICLNPL